MVAFLVCFCPRTLEDRISGDDSDCLIKLTTYPKTMLVKRALMWFMWHTIHVLYLCWHFPYLPSPWLISLSQYLGNLPNPKRLSADTSISMPPGSYWNCSFNSVFLELVHHFSNFFNKLFSTVSDRNGHSIHVWWINLDRGI